MKNAATMTAVITAARRNLRSFLFPSEISFTSSSIAEKATGSNLVQPSSLLSMSDVYATNGTFYCRTQQTRMPQ